MMEEFIQWLTTGNAPIILVVAMVSGFLHRSIAVLQTDVSWIKKELSEIKANQN